MLGRRWPRFTLRLRMTAAVSIGRPSDHRNLFLQEIPSFWVFSALQGGDFDYHLTFCASAFYAADQCPIIPRLRPSPSHSWLAGHDGMTMLGFIRWNAPLSPFLPHFGVDTYVVLPLQTRPVSNLMRPEAVPKQRTGDPRAGTTPHVLDIWPHHSRGSKRAP